MPFCQGCGSEVQPTAAVCLSCGRALAQAPPTYGSAPPVYQYAAAPGYAPYKVQNHMPLAIVSIVLGFCGGCLAIPFGIAALVFAAQVDGKAAMGDIPGALHSSAQARRWSIVAIVAAGISFIISMVLNLLPLVALFSGGELE